MRRNAVWRDGTRDDATFPSAPTICDARRRQVVGAGNSIVQAMDDPIQTNESQFWDDVADWLLESREYDAAHLTDAGIEAMLHRNDDIDLY
jgi:hypothetical protein